jgi:mannitol-1-/sugar-/sorbitol-6-phosphatase
MVLVYRCRAVLLDMDGTLVDSRRAVEAQWGRWAERHGLRLEDVLQISHGRPALETMRMLLPEVATAEEHRRFLREEEEHESGSVAVRGAVRFVQGLPPDRWGVVTSAPGRLALRRMRECGFPTPPVLIAPEHVTRGKPDPLPYRTAAERLGVAPEDCFVVEDTLAGLRSAEAAGMTAIGIATTYTPAQLGADVSVPDFEALEAERHGDTLVIRVMRRA